MCNQASAILYLHLSRPIFHSNCLKVQKYQKKLRKNMTWKLNIALKVRVSHFSPHPPHPSLPSPLVLKTFKSKHCNISYKSVTTSIFIIPPPPLLLPPLLHPQIHHHQPLQSPFLPGLLQHALLTK